MSATPDARSIRHAESDADIARCFPVMAELRPHLLTDSSVEAFIQQVRLQEKEGFRLAYLEDGGEIRAVAGYRVMHKFYCNGLYVDDLVTREPDRSKGYGDAFFDWLLDLTRQLGCAELELDSGVQRFDAHRFYLRKRMKIGAHHFSLKVK